MLHLPRVWRPPAYQRTPLSNSAVESLLVQPHLAPRSTRDLNRTLVAGVLVLLQLAALPLLVGALTYLLTRNAAVTLLAGPLVFLPLALFLAFSQVHWLKLDASGVTFGRHVGRPKRLRWEQITSIRPARASEVVRQGWLWPALRPRDATRSLTAEGHYRIEWNQQFCFFPPEDEHAFRTAVQHWAPGVLSSTWSA